MNVKQIVGTELNISANAISSVLALFKDGGTVPFIARYRKEATGNLDEVQIRQILERTQYWIEFEKRKGTVLHSIEEQGKLTESLRTRIEQCKSKTSLEELYLPFKQKRKTKGQKAIEQGLKPLAIRMQNEPINQRIEDFAFKFVQGEITDKRLALDGAISILSEWISENRFVRDRIRGQFERFALTEAKVKRGKKEEGVKYKDYFDYSEKVDRIASHRALALFRAEKEGILQFRIEVDAERALESIKRIIKGQYHLNNYVEKAVKECYDRILHVQFESEIKKKLKEKADHDSIHVFSENLKQLLLQAPLGSKRIIAIDPGFRTGCKVAVLNRNGDFVESTTIFPHPPFKKTDHAQESLRRLVAKHFTEALAIGNGTAGIETEQFCRNTFKDQDLAIFSVNEAGASIYSASEIAREEFPDLDLTVRGAISIGRRLMDPLAELVKIDAKSIGVGQYQHDVNQVLLKQKLHEVVEHCVNHVGVELNTASYPILSHISGLGPAVAKNIVDFRTKNGNFKERKELLKVTKLGSKTYEQAAGFLRIENGTNPLDNTIIHPESYNIVEEMASANQSNIAELIKSQEKLNSKLAEDFKEKYGVHSVDLILSELQKPTRDPREALKEMETNPIDTIEDLKPGMRLIGKVNNITNFGAFVNIGIKESGLIHISEIANRRITNIHDVLHLNGQVEVIVLSIDIERKRIQLSMKQA
jgi:uncharacterized protein